MRCTRWGRDGVDGWVEWGVGVGGGGGCSLLKSVSSPTSLGQVSEKAGRLFATRSRAGGQWIGSQRASLPFLCVSV